LRFVGFITWLTQPIQPKFGGDFSNKLIIIFLVSMKNGCMGIIFYEFIFRIVGNSFSCQYKLGAAVTKG